jgi:hypothetical protein
MKTADRPIFLLLILLAGTSASAQNANSRAAADTSMWSVLADLHTGTEVTMQVNLARYAQRYFLAASDTEVTVLKMSDPWLPPAARETLRHLAFYEPEYLLGRGGADFVHGNVRVTRDAVYVGNEKALDLSDALQRFPRGAVKEIKRAPRTTTGQALGMLAGGLSGAIAGAMFGHREFEHYKPAGAILTGTSGFVFGLAFGRLVGSLIDPQPKPLIYRAP